MQAIRLAESDYVVGDLRLPARRHHADRCTENGKGRRNRIDDYRMTHRGGKGIRNYAKGGVAAVKIVDDTDDLIPGQPGGHFDPHARRRCINVQSRYGSGVRVMRLAEDDKLAMMARVERDNTAETAKPEEAPEGEDGAFRRGDRPPGGRGRHRRRGRERRPEDGDSEE